MSVLVTEKSIIRKIKFEGNKKLSKSSLSDATTLKSGDPLDLVKLREDVDKMLDKYKEKGFLAADITYRREADTATWHEDLTFVVAEGPKSKIVAVALPGVVSFKPKKIYKQFKNRRKKVFFEKDLPEDIKKIESFYLNKGYLDVAVGTPTVSKYADNTEIAIVIPVSEGRSYKFGETTFSGMAIYTSTQLAWAVEYRKGKVFNHERYEDTVRRIQEMYAEKGRLKMRVSPKKTYNPATGLMDVDYHISEGPIIYVDFVDIELEKAKNTKRWVFERSIVIKPGEQFARHRVLKSRDRTFDSYQIALEPGIHR
jgi:outer membrane protein insertion porin family